MCYSFGAYDYLSPARLRRYHTRHETVYAHLFILVFLTGSVGCQNEIQIGGTQRFRLQRQSTLATYSDTCHHYRVEERWTTAQQAMMPFLVSLGLLRAGTARLNLRYSSPHCASPLRR